jgi:hypothetical protein
MMRIGSSNGNIALDVEVDIIFLYDCVAIFNHEDALFEVLVDFVAIY